MPIKFRHVVFIFALTLVATALMQSPALLWAQPAAAAPVAVQADKFIVVYPGVLIEREKPLVAKYLAENKAIADRGPVDVQALIHGTLPKDTPGIGLVLPVTEAMVRYDNQKYDPDNRVLNDAEYAKSMGYENIQAYATFAPNDDSILKPYPAAARDTLLVSQLNHNIKIYKPIYPGDTLYTVITERSIMDITPPEGSIYRSLEIECKAAIYNQKGEKVNDATFRVVESVKFYKDGLAPKNPGFQDVWEGPPWMTRPAHKYTDKGWEYIKSLWAKEKRQGATPLYWEDVKIGDQPTWTADGPIVASVNPTSPYGMGTGGSRTMKKEIMDPAIFKTMIKDENNGNYLLPNKDDYIPQAPDQKPREGGPGGPPPGGAKPAGDIDTKEIHKQTETRAVLINYFGRDLAIRNIDNWMGDHGTITDIRWGIMEQGTHAAFGKTVPLSPISENFLAHVPSMKGKTVNAHGLTGDLAIVKSYVYDKYVRDGEFYVDLAWWVESIDGYIWEAGGVTVKLPSKNAN
jgi:hypothetical protein